MHIDELLLHTSPLQQFYVDRNNRLSFTTTIHAMLPFSKKREISSQSFPQPVGSFSSVRIIACQNRKDFRLEHPYGIFLKS